MKVTGERATTVKSTRAAQPHQRVHQRKDEEKSWDDGFDAPVKKKQPVRRSGARTPRVEASASLVRAGGQALQRDHASNDWTALRDAGWLLGGLTASVVISVLHQFQSRPTASLDRGVQRLGELCGALFVDYLIERYGPSKQEPKQRAATARSLSRDEAQFKQRFEALFGVTPLEATLRFVEFIAQTEGKPAERLAPSQVYGH